ncbi:MAG: hypothetical protein QOJ19_4398, partial [Acidimicrobiia bacterium]|nr:hypothetical protein [Acidimicrobiia bacterium]
HVEVPGQRPRSSTWLAYGRGSRSVALDLDDEADRAHFFELVEGSDALIESADPGTWERRGLGYEQLSAVNPALVMVSITAFGSSGPKAAYAATDLIVQAASGAMDICGHKERAPLRTAAITAWAHAGAEAAGGALIALAEAQRSGRGQRVEVSAQRAKNLTAFFTLQNEVVGQRRLRRDGSGFQVQGVTFPFVWEAADGFVSLTVAIDPVNKAFLDRLLSWMREEDAIDPDLVDRDWIAHVRAVRTGASTNADLQRLVGSISAFIADRTKGDLLAAALDRRLLLVPVATMDDILTSPQLAERNYWSDAEVADGQKVRLPAHLVLGAPQQRQNPAATPAVGQDTDDVLLELQSRPRRPVAVQTQSFDQVAASAAQAPGPAAAPAPAQASGPATRTTSAGGPLEGLKVLDFMWVMAGPTSTGVLAQYGATVVRIENAARIDTVRLLAPNYDGKPGRERSVAFGSINAGKLSVTLDPNSREAREVIYDLVRWADAVTESFSPKAMKAWGLDHQTLRKIKPDLIMLSSCLFGQNGPYSVMAGYGTMGAAIGGMVQPTGWPDLPPVGPYGAYTDACSPRISVAALLAAIDHRRRTGQGAYLDQSQIEASLHYMTPAIVDHQLNGIRWDRMGNDDLELFPHGVFPAAGEDEWVAVAVRDNDDWHALCGLIGQPAWAADPSLATGEGRRARRAEIDDAIAAWTSKRPPSEAERQLQAVGVPAHAVVHTSPEEDPQLVHAEHVVTVPHSGQPDRRIERTRIDLLRTPADPHHVPALGEHTHQVLLEVLGYSPERVAQLRSCGALGGEPNRS